MSARVHTVTNGYVLLVSGREFHAPMQQYGNDRFTTDGAETGSVSVLLTHGRVLMPSHGGSVSAPL